MNRAYRNTAFVTIYLVSLALIAITNSTGSSEIGSETGNLVALIESLGHEEPDIRANAAYKLGKMGTEAQT